MAKFKFYTQVTVHDNKYYDDDWSEAEQVTVFASTKKEAKEKIAAMEHELDFSYCYNIRFDRIEEIESKKNRK